MTAEDMRLNSRLPRLHGSDHTSLGSGDKGLPPLPLGSARRQRGLQSIPCGLALLCAVFTGVQDWRWGLALWTVVFAWVLWRCPWWRRAGQRLPETLRIAVKGQLQVRFADGRLLDVMLRSRPFLHPRLGVIALRGEDGRAYVCIAFCLAGSALWRRWRLRLHQEWDAKTDPAGPAGGCYPPRSRHGAGDDRY